MPEAITVATTSTGPRSGWRVLEQSAVIHGPLAFVSDHRTGRKLPSVGLTLKFGKCAVDLQVYDMVGVRP